MSPPEDQNQRKNATGERTCDKYRSQPRQFDKHRGEQGHNTENCAESAPDRDSIDSDLWVAFVLSHVFLRIASRI